MAPKITIHEYLRNFTSQKPQSVVEQVRKGQDFATQAICNCNDTVYITKLVDTGLVPVVLEHLQHAQEDFRSYLSKCRGGGGDLAFPSVWLNVLLNLTHPKGLPPSHLERVRTQIAQQFHAGNPVTVSMTTTLLFFGSKDLWMNAVMLYAGLLSNLVLSEPVKVILEERPGAICDFLVRMCFLDDVTMSAVKSGLQMAENRNRCLPQVIGNVQSTALSVLQEFADVPRSTKRKITKDGQVLLQELGDISVGSSTFVKELLPLAKKLRDESFESKGFVSLLYVFRQFVEGLGHGYLGENATTTKDLIQILGTDRVLKKFPDTAGLDICQAIFSSFVLLDVSPEGTPHSTLHSEDAECGIAISNGLLEHFINLTIATQETQIFDCITRILQLVSDTALCSKTLTALLQHYDSVRSQMTKSLKTKGLVPAQRQVLQIMQGIMKKSSFARKIDRDAARFECCRSCFQKMDHSDVKRCSGCKRAIYCSRECQVKDWKEGGHKGDCKLMRTKDISEQKAGKSKDEARDARKAEKNLSISGNRLFSENIYNILLLANLCEVNLLMSVVVLDFCQTSPRIDLITAEEFVAGLDCDAEQCDHTKRIIARNRVNGALTCACMTVLPSGYTETLTKTFPQDVAPLPNGVSHTNGEAKWAVAQRYAAAELPSEVRNNAEFREALKQKLMNPE